jgi:anti-sigma factor RsiW
MAAESINLCLPSDEVNGLIDGELSTERELEVRWHLDLCAVCARSIAAAVAIKRAVGRAYDREVPSLALRRSVVARLSTIAPRRSKRRRQGRADAAAVG